MKTQKMSLTNIQGKLSRAEMKNIEAGSGLTCAARTEVCCTTADCCSGLTCTQYGSPNVCGI